jgi:hypothetical protein
VKVRRTAPELARSLERHGLKFRSFSVQSTGQWSSEDADWNYKDVPHLNQVHTQARAVPGAIGDEIIVTVNMQKIAGIPMPLALANYVATDGSQVYYTTMLCFVLVVETRISPTGEDGRTTVETTYRIGGPSIAMWAFPLLRKVLTANYHLLMSEDLPMREQRGRLRRAGYRFVSDGRDRTFAETTDLTIANVVPPASASSIALAEQFSIALSSLSEGATVMVGAGPGGLRLIRASAEELLIFDRVCEHEGASLDGATMAGDCLVCPWHARRVKPLVSVDLSSPGAQRLAFGPAHEVLIEDQMCTIFGPPSF